MLEMPEGMTMADIHRDNAITAKAARDDAEFDRKSDEHFRTTHPGLRKGRHFLWNVMRHHDSLGIAETFEANYHETFPTCPGSPEWWGDRFCPKCDKRREYCICGTYP